MNTPAHNPEYARAWASAQAGGCNQSDSHEIAIEAVERRVALLQRTIASYGGHPTTDFARELVSELSGHEAFLAGQVLRSRG